jgi:ABC-type bacteriocin/lantibiotic exporter with double-glycine peptidase domain
MDALFRVGGESLRTESDIRWLLRCVSPSRGRILWGFICATLSVLITTVDPLIMRYLIDNAWPNRNLKLALLLVATIGFCYFARTALSGANLILILSITQQGIRDLRTALLNQMHRLSVDYHETTPTGDKLMRIERDVDEIATMGADTANQSIRAVLLFVLNLVMIARLSPIMTLALLPLFPMFIVIQRKFRGLLKVKAEAARKTSGAASSLINEHLAAVPQIQFLGAEKISLAKTITLWNQMLLAQRRQRNTQIRFSLSISAITVSSIVVILTIGTFKVENGTLTIGTIVAFYAFVTRVFDPINSAMDLYARIQSLGASVHRVREVLERHPTVRDEGTLEMTPCFPSGRLSMKHVKFLYGTRNVLDDLSLEFEKGERVALVGTSGSGKSTLARLIVRASDPSSGIIRLGDTPLRDFTLASLRRTFCYVPQHPALFQGTIRENLLYANPEASRDDIEQAVAASQLNSILERLPSGLDTSLGPNAFGLSGGERQRLAIARALLRKASILVLDESTSALDAPTENAVLSAIAKTSYQTLILISHRLSSLTWVDRFVVLDNGHIVDIGNHATLYKRSKLYRSLYEASMQKEES